MRRFVIYLFVMFIFSCGDSKTVKYYEENGEIIASYVKGSKYGDEIILVDKAFEEEDIMKIIDFFDIEETKTNDKKYEIDIEKYEGNWEVSLGATLWEFDNHNIVDEKYNCKNIKYGRLSRVNAKRTPRMIEEDAKEKYDILCEFVNNYNNYFKELSDCDEPARVGNFVNSLNDHINDYEDLTGTQYEKDAQKKIAFLKNKLPSFLAKARDVFATRTRDQLWRDNIDVKHSGTTITFIGGIFASNANIEDTYSGLKPILEKLGFKKVVFRWHKYADGTYYLINQ